MVYRVVDRPVAEVRSCACGDTAFVSVNEQWLVIVDTADETLLASSKWTLQTDGGLYAVRVRMGRKEWLHRLILDPPFGMLADHENRFGLDCRRENLRPATSSQNQYNSAARIGSSAFKGVSFKKSHKKWVARISWRGKQKSLGYFDSEIDAAKAYNAEAKKLYQNFANPNVFKGENQ